MHHDHNPTAEPSAPPATKPAPEPDTRTIQALAFAAVVDPRTLRRTLRGLPVKGQAGERARKVIEQYKSTGTVPQVAA